MKLSYLFAGAVLIAAGSAVATPVTVNLKAEVAYVEDMDNILGGAIYVGQRITGSFTFDSATADSNTLPTVGDYGHFAAPYGMTVKAGGFTFQTDPNQVQFWVEICNDHSNSDNYLADSVTNLPLSNGVYVERLRWQLDDPSMTVLSNDTLPAGAPDIAAFQSVFGLTIDGCTNPEPWGMCGPYGGRFIIRAHVTSAKVEDNDEQ